MNKQLKKQKGFTLIEIMIVVGVLAILSSIAVPSYFEQVRKGKRADAKVELLRIAQLQESYFAQNLSYAQDLTSPLAAGGLGIAGPVRSEKHEYVISMDALDSGGGACTGTSLDSCSSYTITADPGVADGIGTGSQFYDTDCLRFTITNTGLKGTTASATAVEINKCWK